MDKEESSVLLKFDPKVPISAQLNAAQHLIDSNLLPQGIETPEQVITITQMGHELGLKPLTAINNIAVINGKPVIGSSILGSMLQRAGYEYKFSKDFENEGTAEQPKYVSEVTLYWISKNLNREMQASYRFSWNEASKMGLTKKDNWVKMPRTMLNWRTLAFATRFLAPQVLLGNHTIDEIADTEDIPYTILDDGTTVIQQEAKEFNSSDKQKKSNGKAEITI